MIISKSKYCKGIQCPKILWMDNNMPEKAELIDNEAVFATGNEVGELARKYFDDYAEVQWNPNKDIMVSETKRYLEDGQQVIAEASFLYNDGFCSVDILSRNEDGSVDIIEVKSSTEISEIYYHDMAFQYYVVSHSGVRVNKVYNMHLNRDYVRWGQLDLEQLFVIEDVTAEVLSLQSGIQHHLREIQDCLREIAEPEEEIDVHCHNPYPCAYHEYCHRHIPKDSIFAVHGMRKQKKYDLYRQGIVTYEDIVFNQPKMSEKQMRQVEAAYYQEPPVIDSREIKAFLDTLAYPMYFLDFETYQQAVPKFDGVKPYAQIPFQYSLHVQRASDAKLEHYEFLGKEGEDPRRTLAEQLCREIPLDVCTLAYNMGFEKGRIKEMAELYPDLAVHLMNIHDNIKDLMIPFQKQYYYSKELQGSYSIKYVLPALCKDDPELDYHALEGIHNGGEAMNAFATLPDHTPEEIKEIRKNLLAYCRLDTLAMVKILEKLREMI